MASQQAKSGRTAGHFPPQPSTGVGNDSKAIQTSRKDEGGHTACAPRHNVTSNDGPYTKALRKKRPLPKKTPASALDGRRPSNKRSRQKPAAATKSVKRRPLEKAQTADRYRDQYSQQMREQWERHAKQAQEQREHFNLTPYSFVVNKGKNIKEKKRLSKEREKTEQDEAELEQFSRLPYSCIVGGGKPKRPNANTAPGTVSGEGQPTEGEKFKNDEVRLYLELSRARRIRDDANIELEKAREEYRRAKERLDAAEEQQKNSEEQLNQADEAVAEMELSRPCTWNEKFAKLRDIVKKHGTHRIPRVFPDYKKDPELLSLTRWVIDQRRRYNAYKKKEEGRPGTTIHIEIAALQKLGVFADPWNDMYDKFAQHKQEHGTCTVSTKDNMQLAHWIIKNRRDYRLMKEGKSSKMTEERLEKLKRLELDFDDYVPPTKTWEERLEELQIYKEINGHVNVPQKHPGLGEFVNRMRKLYKYWGEGKPTSLTEDRIAALEGLGFRWRVRKGGGKRRSTHHDEESGEEEVDSAAISTSRKARHEEMTSTTRESRASGDPILQPAYYEAFRGGQYGFD